MKQSIFKCFRGLRNRGQKTEVRRRKTEVRRQRSEVRGQRTEDCRQRADGIGKWEGGSRKAKVKGLEYDAEGLAGVIQYRWLLKHLRQFVTYPT